MSFLTKATTLSRASSSLPLDLCPLFVLRPHRAATKATNDFLRVQPSLNSDTLRRHRSTAAATQLKHILDEQLEGIRTAGTWKSERVIVSKQATGIRVAGNEGEEILNFCANNYLGLSSHPEVVEAGKKALDTHGAGLSSVRFICGTQDIHKVGLWMSPEPRM